MRIALIHALRESVEPARSAMARGWQDATVMNILDDSLSADLATHGVLTDSITDRFLSLGRYAKASGANGILFTCSAFGRAIDAVREDLNLPVLKPNESAFNAAITHGKRIALLVTFEGSLAPLKQELIDLVGCQDIHVDASTVPGALEALQRGDPKSHDEAIARAAETHTSCDVVILGQFSMARARATVASQVQAQVLTTPDAAVADLRRLVGHQA